ncbi:MAG: hypothetical protein FWE28_06210 [Oscillospiraceae bacterium]|nr:hypothetical protein [Oscillospiraceae bacterium]
MQANTEATRKEEPDYRELYFQLLRTQDKAIRILQEGHITAEEAHMSTEK